MAISRQQKYESIEKYHKILSPDYPDFLDEYVSLSILQRLEGVGLLCGTDWTNLYDNNFFYTRLDHSIGTALVTWHFTHDKKQTLASLFHDVATPAFSHASDFRKNDALTQQTTEELTSEILTFDSDLAEINARSGINVCEIRDYHMYPICDNGIPRLSSDRLEYMFPSAMALSKKLPNPTWNLDSVKATYENIVVLKNEEGIDELGFESLEVAEDYASKFNDVALILQKNENKLCLNLIGDILNMAVTKNIATEADFYNMSEKRLLEEFFDYSVMNPNDEFSTLFETFIKMREIIRSETPLKNCYCVSLDVKKRYINPLVRTKDGAKRVSEISGTAKDKIENLLNFKDSKFGCVKLISY